MQETAALKILVVDDNEASAQTLSWMIELAGHEVRTALDGTSGINIAREFLPHMVLLDIGLPVMNGYEICAIMRKDPLLKDTLFIAQTGWGQPEHRQRSREAGFDYHLVKPIKMQQLQEIMHSMTPMAASKAS